MHVVDPAGELTRRTGGVAERPNEMRRVEIQAEGVARHGLEDSPPEGGGIGQVATTGPLVGREDHRTVLDRDSHAAICGMSHQPRTLLQAFRKSRLRELCLVAPDEGSHEVRSEARGGVDHLAQMRLSCSALSRVGVQRIRVVSKRGDREPVAFEELVNAADGGVVQLIDVDVGDPGIPPALGPGGRPACDLQGFESIAGSPRSHLRQGPIRKGRSHKANIKVTAILITAPVRMRMLIPTKVFPIPTASIVALACLYGWSHQTPLRSPWPIRG